MKTPEQIQRCVSQLRAFVIQHTFESALADLGGWPQERKALITEADWQRFGQEVDALTPEMVIMDTRRTSAVGFLASIHPSGGVWDAWAHAVASEKQKAAEAAWIASTVRVLTRQPNGKLKASRVLPADLPLWHREGMIIAAHRTMKSTPVRSDDGKDNLSFFSGKVEVVAYRNGDELDLGTVKDMRVVEQQTQYLIKPRSKGAEARYQAALQQIAKLEQEWETAHIDESYYQAKELREQIAQVKREARIPEKIAPLEVVDYDALHA